MKSKAPKNLKIIAVIQARTGSKRLPGKAILKIQRKTITQIIFERLKSCKEIDGVVLSTSSSKENDVLADHAKKIGLACHRGPEDDLITRHLGAMKKLEADAVLRVTGDCLFADTLLADRMVKYFKKNQNCFDLLTNCFPPTWPDGLDLDIISKETVEKLNEKIKDEFHREYYIAYMMANPEKFKVQNFPNKKNLSYLRWTLDYPEDLEFAKKVFSHFAPNAVFSTKDVLQYLKKNPKVAALNENRVDSTIINKIRSAVYHAALKKHE